MAETYKPTIEEGGEIVKLEREASDIILMANTMSAVMKLHVGSAVVGIKPREYIAAMKRFISEARQQPDES